MTLARDDGHASRCTRSRTEKRQPTDLVLSVSHFKKFAYRLYFKKPVHDEERDDTPTHYHCGKRIITKRFVCFLLLITHCDLPVIFRFSVRQAGLRLAEPNPAAGSCDSEPNHHARHRH